MSFGLSPSEYQYILDTVVTPLNKLDAKVWCYGSRARGDHQKFSDLDLMIESNKDLGSIASRIKETLQESNFPLKVDLVLLSEFADSYKPRFEKENVLFEGTKSPSNH